jgi:hypothetical protein
MCDPDRAFDDFDKMRAEGTTNKSGNYFASVFRLKKPKAKTDAVMLLWRKAGKYWKVIAWDVEPEEATPDKIPDMRRRRAVAKAGRAETQAGADPDFVHASRDFCIHGWWPIISTTLQPISPSDPTTASWLTFQPTRPRHPPPPTTRLIFAAQ